jgi:hypothetical protein
MPSWRAGTAARCSRDMGYETFTIGQERRDEIVVMKIESR